MRGSPALVPAHSRGSTGPGAAHTLLQLAEVCWGLGGLNSAPDPARLRAGCWEAAQSSTGAGEMCMASR